MKLSQLHRSRTLFSGFLLLVFAGAGPVGPSILVSAQDSKAAAGKAAAEEKLPAAREIVDKFIKALGGREAFAKIKSQHAKGKFTMPAQGISGDLEIFAARPDRMLVKISIPGLGDILQGYDGKVGWAVNPATGPDVMEGKQLDQIRTQADFDAILHDEASVKSMETLGIENFDGVPCYKIKVVKQTGQEVTEYYEKEGFWLRGFLVTVESPLGAIATTNILGDYKPIDGFRFATRVRQKMGPLEQEMTFSEMILNKVDPKVFVPPAEIQALLKK